MSNCAAFVTQDDTVLKIDGFRTERGGGAMRFF